MGAHELDELGRGALDHVHRLAKAAAQLDDHEFIGDLDRPPHRPVVLPALEVLDRDLWLLGAHCAASQLEAGAAPAAG